MSKRILQLSVLLGVFGSLLGAQTGVGQIQGTVSDSSGALIPGAVVILENPQTEHRIQTTTSESGFFVFPSLVSGEYRLTISAKGMQKWEGTSALVTGQRAAIDAKLEVAKATEQITVAGDVTPLLSTSSPTVAAVVERARIEQLPLNGRSIQTLLSIAVPGLEGSTSQPKIFGLRDSAMDLLQDGELFLEPRTPSVGIRLALSAGDSRYTARRARTIHPLLRQ